MSDSEGDNGYKQSEYLGHKNYYNQYSPLGNPTSSQNHSQHPRYLSPCREATHLSNDSLMNKVGSEGGTPPSYSSDNSAGRHWPPTNEESEIGRPVTYVPVL